MKSAIGFTAGVFSIEGAIININSHTKKKLRKNHNHFRNTLDGRCCPSSVFLILLFSVIPISSNSSSDLREYLVEHDVSHN